MNRIWNLVSVEARIEWRERSVLSGILLYGAIMVIGIKMVREASRMKG